MDTGVTTYGHVAFWVNLTSNVSNDIITIGGYYGN